MDIDFSKAEHGINQAKRQLKQAANQDQLQAIGLFMS